MCQSFYPGGHFRAHHHHPEHGDHRSVIQNPVASDQPLTVDILAIRRRRGDMVVIAVERDTTYIDRVPLHGHYRRIALDHTLRVLPRGHLREDGIAPGAAGVEAQVTAAIVAAVAAGVRAQVGAAVDIVGTKYAHLMTNGNQAFTAYCTIID